MGDFRSIVPFDKNDTVWYLITVMGFDRSLPMFADTRPC
jgi:hypothetical protein